MSVRFGIIGPGTIAHRFADAVARVPQATLYAVASTNLQRAEDFATKYGASVSYDNYEALFVDDNVDVVYITLPHHLHVPVALQAISHGKAVICEKPLTTNHVDAKKVVDAANEKGVLFMEAMWTNHLPTTKKAHQWIAEHKIGNPSLMTSSFGFCTEVNPTSRLFDPALAGGALYDIGCYCIASALALTKQPPIRVEGSAIFGSTKVDEVGTAILTFSDDFLAQINFSIRATTEQDAVIYGDKGKIVLKQFWGCKEVYCYDNDGKLVDSFTDMQPEGFVYQVEEMCRLFQNGETQSKIVSWEHTLWCAQVVDQLKEQWPKL